MSIIFKEKTNFYNKVNERIEQLTENEWYRNAGQKEVEVEELVTQFLDKLAVQNYEIKWTNKQELANVISRFTFQNSDIWEKLKDLPDQLKERVVATNREEELDKIVDWIPELVYHPTFDGAFKQFGEEKVVSYLVGNGMYLALLISVAELVEEDLMDPIIQVIMSGHIPVGITGNTVYII